MPAAPTPVTWDPMAQPLDSTKPCGRCKTVKAVHHYHWMPRQRTPSRSEWCILCQRAASADRRARQGRAPLVPKLVPGFDYPGTQQPTWTPIPDGWTPGTWSPEP